MRKDTIALVLAVLALVLGGVAIFHAPSASFGGQLYNFNQTNFANGFSAGKASQFAVSSTGCINATATSSATAIKLTPVASSTQMAPGYNGIVYWQYGSC